MAAPTLADAKAQLNISSTNTTQDAEITLYLSAAQSMIERRVGTFTVQSWTETITTHANDLLVSHRPLVSITSVTPALKSFPTFDVTTLGFDGPAGRIYRTDLGTLAGSYVVTYTAGLSAVSDNVRLATLIALQHLWKTQRGGSSRPGLGQSDEFQANTGAGYALPWMAVELLGSADLMQGIA